MTATRYSLREHGNQLLTRSFRVREFACRDGSDEIIIHPALPPLVQAVRDYFAAPVQITSGYRTPAWNRAVGGEPNSFHMRGMAADIVVTGKSPREVFQAIDRGEVPGVDPSRIGLGLYTRQGFVHMDCRGSRGRWGS